VDICVTTFALTDLVAILDPQRSSGVCVFSVCVVARTETQSPARENGHMFLAGKQTARFEKVAKNATKHNKNKSNNTKQIWRESLFK
jgi:hypothetical protein